jgi:hypothetical protein
MARERENVKHGGAPQRRKREKDDRRSEVPGAPPTDNVRKHPDEVYGDTESHIAGITWIG